MPVYTDTRRGQDVPEVRHARRRSEDLLVQRAELPASRNRYKRRVAVPEQVQLVTPVRCAEELHRLAVWHVLHDYRGVGRHERRELARRRLIPSSGKSPCWRRKSAGGTGSPM